MYYHILIDGKETGEILELDIKQRGILKQEYVLPYLKNTEVTLDGFIVQPSKISRFIIVESDSPSKECYNSALSTIGPNENRTLTISQCLFKDKTRVKDITKKIFKEVKEQMENSNDYSHQHTLPSNKTIFLGYSYLPSDDEFASGFKELLILNGWEVIDGKADGLSSISDAILDKISICEMVVLVMSKRDEKQNGEFTTSSWLVEEKGAALALKKQVGIFVEEGINISDIGGIHGDRQLFFYNKNSFVKVVTNFLRIISPKSI